MSIYKKNKDVKSCDKKVIITYDRKRCELGMAVISSDINLVKFEEEQQELVIWWKEFDFVHPQVFETLKLLCLESVASTTNGNHEERILEIQWHLNKWGEEGYKVLNGKADDIFSKLIA